MNKDKTDHKNFEPTYSPAELFMMYPGAVPRSENVSDLLKIIRDLQSLRLDLEKRNQELLRSQQELMESKIRYTELYDTAPVGYLSLDLKGFIVNANRTTADMLSMERPSILNTQFKDYIIAEDRDVYSRHMQELDSLKMPQTCELRMQKMDGPLFDVQLKSFIVTGSCRYREQYRAMILDISTRKREEKAREMVQAKLNRDKKIKTLRTIIGGIAHDFNNIFHIILGNVELSLDENPIFNPAHVNLKKIKSAALRGSDIVKQLIEFNQKTKGNFKPTGVVEIIKETIDFLQPSIPATIKIIRQFPDKDVSILADRNKIGQVLKNLCANALQAMEETGGQLEITVGTKRLKYADMGNFSDLTPGLYAQIKVRDTGAGIRPEIIDQIFDPYFTTRGFENCSGMGLTVVHNIVKNHNGNISVDSQPGKGTVFKLLFPLISQLPEAETQKKMNVLPRGSETILFVDDEESVLSMAKAILENLGYKVITRMNPLEALDLFQSKPLFYDLVITDIMMPQMNGMALVGKILKIRPDIPIIICTGHRSQINKEKARQLGIADYVIKPLSLFDIAGRIRKIFDQEQSSIRSKADQKSGQD